MQQQPQQKLELVTILLIFLMAAMMAIFMVSLLIVMIKKLRAMLISLKNRFYIFIILDVIGNMAMTGIILVYILSGIHDQWASLKADSLQIIFKNNIMMSDLFMIELFLSAVCTYFRLSLNALKRPSRSTIIPKLLTILQILCIPLLVAPLILFNCDILSYQIVNIAAAGMNFLSILVFLVSFFYLNFTMTGILLDSSTHNSIKAIYKVQFLLLLGRAITTAFEIIIMIDINNGSFQSFVDILIEKQGEYIIFGILFIGFIIFFLLCSAIPIMYSLRTSIMEGFNHESQVLEETFNQESLISSRVLEDTIWSDSQPIAFDESSFHHLVDLPTLEASIWKLRRGSMGDEQYIIRTSRYEISSYILEQVENQLRNLKTLSLCCLNSISYIKQSETIHLIQRFHGMNLDAKVDAAISEFQLIKLGHQLALSIEELHIHGIYHGALKPSQIFFDHNDRIKINDYGLHSLKKYLSLITGYSNKSMYSAIQILKDKNSVTMKTKKEADIYSFGMMFYEIVSRNRLYRQQPFQEIHRKFVTEEFRPKIPSDTNLLISNLIRKCWQQDEYKRPAIQEVISTLNKVLK